MNRFLALLSILFLASIASAQDYSDPVSEGEIIVEKPTDLTQSYRDRRSRFGILFSINYEKFSPNNYLSLIQNKTFEEMSGGDSIPLIGAEFGVKINFSLGSLAGIIGYAGGNYANTANKVDNISLKVTKAAMNFALDNLMSEPLVVPYGQVGASSADWLEKSRDTGDVNMEEAFTTDWNLNYKVGLLFQLDWIEGAIDSNTHVNGLRASGLQNTFLDVFYASYQSPSEVATVSGASGEPDLQSENFGVGLKMEF